jgi:ADP-ribose pyrophosphatase
MTETLFAGRHLKLTVVRGWEYCERTVARGVVGVIAVTADRCLILVEQHRLPVGARVLELPAGLAGDLGDAPDEAFEAAAQRELIEETGYEAASLELVCDGPGSAGLTSERMHLFVASGLRRVADGGGVHGEDIVVHEVPLAEAQPWLAARRREGVLVDPKVFAALFFAGQVWDGASSAGLRAPTAGAVRD